MAEPELLGRIADPEITVRSGLRSGDPGRIIALHGTGYRQEAGEFGLVFEAYVAKSLADFIIEDRQKGEVWLAERGSQLVGCAAMLDRGGKGQLRWVVVDPDARGSGLGRLLIDTAINYAKTRQWTEVYLETTFGLEVSYEMYLRRGFVVSEPPRDWIGSRQMIVMRHLIV